jgi:hypothetical protein
MIVVRMIEYSLWNFNSIHVIGENTIESITYSNYSNNYAEKRG